MVAKHHYDECPYGCNQNGMLLNPDTGKMEQCPYCYKKKKELLAQGYVESEEVNVNVPLSTVLGIESAFLSTKFIYEAIIPDGEKIFIDEESLNWQSDCAENLYLGLTVGTLPASSMCFGVSIKGRVDKFAYPMLAKAYLAGLSIGKFISCTEFCRLAFKMDDSVDDLYNCDFLMMLINDGSNLADIASAKGLMQSRALKGKPTIFVTTWTIEACSGLLGYSSEENLFLAKPLFVKYKSSKSGKQSSYINNLLGVKNEKLDVQKESGKGISLKDLF